MKKIIPILLILLALCAVFVPVSAESAPPVAVIYGVMTDSEFDSLTARLDSLCDTYDVDIAFIVSDEIVTENAVTEADAFCDTYGYGSETSKGGILFFVCTSTHEYALSTCGEAAEIFGGDALDYIESAANPHLKKGEYYKAGDIFADKCEEIIEKYESGEPYKKKANPLLVIGGIVLIPLIAALAFTGVKQSRMNTATGQSEAEDYIRPDSMKLERSEDIFLYSKVTKREKPKSDSSSSTSSHGGKSGSF